MPIADDAINRPVGPHQGYTDRPREDLYPGLIEREYPGGWSSYRFESASGEWRLYRYRAASESRDLFERGLCEWLARAEAGEYERAAAEWLASAVTP